MAAYDIKRWKWGQNILRMILVTCRFGIQASTRQQKNMGACWAGKQLENRTPGSWWSCQGVNKRLTIRMKSSLWRSQAKVDQRIGRDNFENVNMLLFKDKRVWRYAGDLYQQILLEIRGRRKTKPPVLNHVHSSDFQTRERWRSLIKEEKCPSLNIEYWTMRKQWSGK